MLVYRGRLHQARKMNRLSQKDLAMKIGKDSPYISHLENGKVVPKLDVGLLLESILEVPMKELFPDVYEKVKKA
ncbi:helix-turn-helix transcriptional regulator [Thermoactinomyces sp. DSM 45892]|uniref:helix-turn-helix transcriptional regulator n=1 Tax=Thermoactinomyces sp. DSM 45892 TaxID=1882753 RepID=UPI000894634C|nr:helix-turn-helix transcriptional regulator [Thermoactinomyces sp. DSM 45892]SDY68757.1 DNA-binding transcriptional regulator, XRE-family HTH domain [Thermoactinomyces sp. DSM 45892]